MCIRDRFGAPECVVFHGAIYFGTLFYGAIFDYGTVFRGVISYQVGLNQNLGRFLAEICMAPKLLYVTQHD